MYTFKIKNQQIQTNTWHRNDLSFFLSISLLSPGDRGPGSSTRDAAGVLQMSPALQRFGDISTAGRFAGEQRAHPSASERLGDCRKNGRRIHAYQADIISHFGPCNGYLISVGELDTVMDTARKSPFLAKTPKIWCFHHIKYDVWCFHIIQFITVHSTLQ